MANYLQEREQFFLDTSETDRKEFEIGSLVHLIESWSIEKGLHEGDPLVQFSKVIEEIGEIAECLTKGASENETRLEIGDAVVTLIILAQRLNLDFNVCINEAYDKIKDRKGRMIDGVFVKESDLTSIPEQSNY